MLVLIKKELKSLLCHPFSLAVISVLNLVPIITLAIFLKISQNQSAYAGFENIVSLMVLFFAVAIPIVSIISLCREKNKGTDEFVYSMPVSKAMFTLSKIFALIIFFAIPVAIMAIFPFVLKSLGGINLLHSYTALIMLVAFEIFLVAFSVMVAEKKGKTVISAVIAYSALAVSFLCGILSSLVRLLPLGTGFDKIFGGILFELSFFKKADTAVYELFDWTALLFFLLGAAIFAVVAVTKLKRQLVSVFVSLALVACIGILPMLLPYSVRQADINQHKLYTPSASVDDYLSSLDEEITVYLIDPYTNEQELYNAILRTVEVSNNIKLKTVNSAEDKEFLEKYGLENESQETLSYAMIVQGEKRWSFLSGQDYFSYYNQSMGYLSASELEYRYTYCATIVNQYYSRYESLSAEMQTAVQKCVQILQSLQNETLVCLQFEDAFADAVAYVTADMIPTVYFLTGHGEEGTAANPYDFKANGDLPKDADVAVINSPSEDYTESEIKALINYVDNGGKLYILTDVDNHSMPNFMSLLAHYGLDIEDKVIRADEKTVLTVSVNTAHEAFNAMSAKEVTVKDVSKITIAEDSKYIYYPMLSYHYKEADGENEQNSQCPVAIAVCDDKDESKITVFTGATTFNTANNGISEEELERVSPTVTNVLSWMFDEFESGLSQNPAKLYQKTLFVADDGQITKITVAFSALTLIITLSLIAYIVARNLRSKRASQSK